MTPAYALAAINSALGNSCCPPSLSQPRCYYPASGDLVSFSGKRNGHAVFRSSSLSSTPGKRSGGPGEPRVGVFEMIKPNANPILAAGLFLATLCLSSFVQAAGADAYHSIKRNMTRRQGEA